VNTKSWASSYQAASQKDASDPNHVFRAMELLKGGNTDAAQSYLQRQSAYEKKAYQRMTSHTMMAYALLFDAMKQPARAQVAARRAFDWRIPVALLTTVATLAALAHAVDPDRYAAPLFMLFSGGLMLGAVFMATDPVASPVTPLGCWLYGALIGALVVAIRYWGGLPEGVMYAILLGNACAPLIERLTRIRPSGVGARDPDG